MKTTRATLIERVRDAGDQLAWREFYELYAGLIYRYARQRGLNDTDAAEVVADCMESLSRRMREFDYDPRRCKFRSYLRIMVANKVAELLRKKRPRQADTADLKLLQDDEDSPDERWEKQWDISHLLFCWARVEKEVSGLYADAFRLSVIKELPAREVAEMLDITPNHVYQIKARMTQRLREVMTEVSDGEP